MTLWGTSRHSGLGWDYLGIPFPELGAWVSASPLSNLAKSLCVMVTLGCQLNGIENHHGNRPGGGICEGILSVGLLAAGRAHSKHGWHPSRGWNPERNRKEKANRTSVLISLYFLTIDSM